LLDIGSLSFRIQTLFFLDLWHRSFCSLLFSRASVDKYLAHLPNGFLLVRLLSSVHRARDHQLAFVVNARGESLTQTLPNINRQPRSVIYSQSDVTLCVQFVHVLSTRTGRSRVTKVKLVNWQLLWHIPNRHRSSQLKQLQIESVDHLTKALNRARLAREELGLNELIDSFLNFLTASSNELFQANVTCRRCWIECFGQIDGVRVFPEEWLQSVVSERRDSVSVRIFDSLTSLCLGAVAENTFSDELKAKGLPESRENLLNTGNLLRNSCARRQCSSV
jgi:hypothetical protein